MKRTSQMNKYWIKNKYLNEDRLDSYYYSQKFMSFEDKINKVVLKKCKIIEMFKVLDGEHGTVENEIEGVLYLRAQNIKDGYIDYDNLVYITAEQHSKSKRSMIYNQDILLSIMASTGMAAVFNKEVECNANRAVGILRRKTNSVDVYFLVALINSKVGGVIFSRGIRGSIQKRLNLSDISEIEVPIPSTEIQKYIGDKVRKAEELREEAKRLKEQGNFLIEEILNINKHLGEINDDKEKYRWLKIEVINDRIDGEYYKKKYLEIINHLKGSSFQYIPLKKMVLDMYTGKKPSEMANGKEVFFIQSGNISGNFLEVEEKVRVKIENYKVIEKGDLLIAKDGNTIGKMAVNFSNELAIINEHTYCIRFNEDYKKYSAYVHYLLINDNINELIKREATGSAQKGLNQQFIDNMIIPLINKESVEKLYEIENKRCNNIYLSKQLIQEAKKDVEDLIEGNFDMSNLSQS